MSDRHDWMAGMTDFQRAEVARLESRIVSCEKRWQSLEADWNDCKKALATAMAELAATYSHQASSKSVLANVIAERDALRKRVAELESRPPASDLRERLLESALRGVSLDIERLRAELAAAIKQRDEARQELCRLIGYQRQDRFDPKAIAAERGWDCYEQQEGGGA